MLQHGWVPTAHAVGGWQLAPTHAVAGRLSISYSAARQLFVYTKNSTRKCYVNHSTIKHGWVGAKLGHAFNCTWSVICWGRQLRPCLQLHVVKWYAEEGNLDCVALAVSFSGFHSGRRLICCTDWTVMLISSLLWEICSSLDSGLLETAVKVSKSCHNSIIKSLIQNSPNLFQDNIALSLHCTFQSLMFSDCRENVNSILQNDTLTHTHVRWLLYASNGLCPPTEA